MEDYKEVSNLVINKCFQCFLFPEWFFGDLWKLDLSNVTEPNWSFKTGDDPLNPTILLSNYGNQPGRPGNYSF
jgi:hypothetical protein